MTAIVYSNCILLAQYYTASIHIILNCICYEIHTMNRPNHYVKMSCVKLVDQLALLFEINSLRNGFYCRYQVDRCSVLVCLI